MIKQRKFDPTVPLLLHGTAGLESMSNLSVSDSRQDHGFRFVDSRQWWCQAEPRIPWPSSTRCQSSSLSASVCGMQKSVLTNAATGG